MNAKPNDYDKIVSDGVSQKELTEEERCIHSLFGTIRFDYKAVANALRSRSLTILQSHALADLIEGTRADGVSLKVDGQGRNWTPIEEDAAKFHRAIAISNMMNRLRQSDETWEQATLETADYFGISESTVSRAVAVGRWLQDTEK